MDNYYMGLDLGTQQLKTVVINGAMETLYSNAITYDISLPEFRTTSGVHQDGEVVTAPVLMWIKALDLTMKHMQLSGIDVNKISFVSGAAQQHGSVYWKWGAADKLENLKCDMTICDQLKESFATLHSPVWLDSSTRLQATELENSVGGAERLCEITGSTAHLRFTGSQILKKYRENPELMNETERISLVSSFLCSIFIGHYAPIDFCDASGMNLLDITRRVWSAECLKIFPAELPAKLGRCVPASTCVGFINPYFVKRYGFTSDCRVIAFTGDNCSSLAGLNQGTHDLSISLGTSDTMFICMDKVVPLPNGHVFCNPIECQSYMGLICYSNGGYTRSLAKIRLCGQNATWQQWEDLVQSCPMGNDGYFGLFFDKQEIGSHIPQGHYLFNSNLEMVKCFEKKVEARAVMEHQCFAKFLNASQTGMLSKIKKIIITGGASGSFTIAQTLSNVFNLPVYKSNVQHSAAFGGAVRARRYNFSEIGSDDLEKFDQLNELVATPDQRTVYVYSKMMEKYAQALQRIKQATVF